MLTFLVLAIVGPMITAHVPLDFTGPTDAAAIADYWFGTTSFGQDVFSQFVHGLRATFLVGIVGGSIAWVLGAIIGFTAGYRSGWVDDLLNMLTNVVLVIPTLAILIIVAAYVNVHSYVDGGDPHRPDVMAVGGDARSGRRRSPSRRATSSISPGSAAGDAAASSRRRSHRT